MNKRELYKGKLIKTARPTGGKAGKHLNKTSTVQVLDPVESILLKQIRFDVGDLASFESAWDRAKDFIDGKETKRGGARPGAGIRREPLVGGKFRPTYLDDPTVEIFSELGEGNLSEGARRAAKVVSQIGVSGSFLLLEGKDLGIEEERGK